VKPGSRQAWRHCRRPSSFPSCNPAIRQSCN